jgi:TonB family protein
VPQSAKDTIRGTVRVNVRVAVDGSGNVVSTQLESPSVSRYFAGLAQKAAQQWKFKPSGVSGNAGSSRILRFEFTRDGTRAVPIEETR